MARITPLNPDRYSPEQKKLAERITASRGGVRGPYAIWIKNPKLADCVDGLGKYARFDTSLPQRLSELAILVVTRHWTAQYAWQAHEKIARKEGISEDAIQAIRGRTRPSFTKKDEQAVFDFVYELTERKAVSDPSYRNALEALGEDALIELVTIAGYYTLVSMTLNAFEAPIPEGVTPLAP
jgi:4-carboxymuconolactone decarboxylase